MPILLCYEINLKFIATFVFRHWTRHIPDGAALEAEWNAKFAEYEKKHKEEAAELKSIIDGVLPVGWESALPVSKTHSF